MSLDSLYIINNFGEILASKNYKKHNHQLTIQQFFEKFQELKDNKQLDLQYPIVQIDNISCAFIIYQDLILVALLSEDSPLIQIFNLLYFILEIIKSSYGQSNQYSLFLKQEFDKINLMLDQFLCYGYPLVFQKQVLEQLIKPSTTINKIGDALIGKNIIGNDSLNYLQSYVSNLNDIRDYSMQRMQIKENDSIYFDVIEFYDCLLDKEGSFINEEINGEIKCDCHLQNIPTVNVFLHFLNNFNDFSIHECLYENIESIETERLLQFIPPTGNFSLFYYSIKNLNNKLPFEMIPKLEIKEDQVQINLKVESRLIRGQGFDIDEFHFKFLLPEGLKQQDVQYVDGNLYVNDQANVINFQYDKIISKFALWKLGQFKKEQRSQIQMNFKSIQENFNLKQCNFSICIKFEIQSFSFSGTKIEKVTIQNSHSSNIVKKARYIAKSGYFEYRLN